MRLERCGMIKVTSKQYLEANPDVAEVGVDPLYHALTYTLGRGEPRCLEYPDALATAEGKAAYLAAWQDVRDAGADPLAHYLRWGWLEGRWPLPGTKPSLAPEPTPSNKPGGEIVAFDHIATVDSPIFAIGKPDGIYYAVYGYGADKIHSTEIYKLGNVPNEPIQRIEAESGIAMCDDLLACENFGPKDVGAILQFRGGLFEKVFDAGSYGWDLMLALKKAPDGSYRATGMNFGDRSNPAGILQSVNKRDWTPYYINPNEYRFFEMDFDSEGNLWTASTSSGTDWGKNNCNPCVFRNRDLVWRDETRPNDGAWGIKCAFGDVFYGRTGHAAVVSVNKRRPVLEMPGHEACHTLLFDDASKTLLAFFSGEAGNARIMGTKDGAAWYEIDSLPCSGCWFGFQDPDTKEIYAGAGVWNNKGMLFRSRR